MAKKGFAFERFNLDAFSSTWKPMIPYLLVLFVIASCLGLIWFVLYRKRLKLDAEWEVQHPRAKFRYCGKTVLFYEYSHGNQIEFLDPDGYCYLWYPGNPIILIGRWRTDEFNIYFQYGTNTFNPVTNITGGSWERCPVDAWSVSIVEAVHGDILEIAKRIPFVLNRDPAITSLHELRSSRRY
jgi:hypothetical protein